ncbi:hypothetical protein AAG570_009079 [Ranatra chinensis]|uniref:Uncharacterized protein n=1 Tax=Ranatra chinensis TaxID=642074 RepID=A0ABD0Z9S8_9HEMI
MEMIGVQVNAGTRPVNFFSVYKPPYTKLDCDGLHDILSEPERPFVCTDGIHPLGKLPSRLVKKRILENENASTSAAQSQLLECMVREAVQTELSDKLRRQIHGLEAVQFGVVLAQIDEDADDFQVAKEDNTTWRTVEQKQDRKPQKYYWPAMARMVVEELAKCRVCAQAKDPPVSAKHGCEELVERVDREKRDRVDCANDKATDRWDRVGAGDLVYVRNWWWSGRCRGTGYSCGIRRREDSGLFMLMRLGRQRRRTVQELADALGGLYPLGVVPTGSSTCNDFRGEANAGGETLTFTSSINSSRTWFCTCSKRTRDMVKTHVQDYCGATTIHGVQYLAEARRPITERLWWVIVFIASFCVNSYMISKIWEKWHETPVIVSFDEKTTPVWEVPFPAITICPEARFDAHALNFSHLYSSQNLTQGLADAAMLCEYYSVSPGIPDWLAEDNEFTSDNVTDYFSEVSFL